MATLKFTHIKESQRVDLEKWAQITVEKWEYNVASKNLIYSGDLLNSFQISVSQDANGDVGMITFAFNYYLRMLDMGVGKGVTLDNVKGSNRRAYKVFNRTFYSEFRKLVELLTDSYQKQGVTVISENVTV